MRKTTSRESIGFSPVTLVRATMFVMLLALGACGTNPPVQEMSDARQAIAVAREAGAAEYAAVDLRAAEDYLDSALRNLSRKDYALARADAVEAKAKAMSALASAEASNQANPQP